MAKYKVQICEWCGELMKCKRRSKKTCSERCRTALSRFNRQSEPKQLHRLAVRAIRSLHKLGETELLADIDEELSKISTIISHGS